MFNSKEPLDKENNILFKNINDSIEKTNYGFKYSKNNNSLFLSSITNFDLSSQNDSIDLCGENVDFSFIKFPPSPIIFRENEEDIIKKNEKKNKRCFNIEKKKIFHIQKIIKLGRNKKLSSKKGKHNKFQKDNLIRKFKVHLTRNILNFVNGCFLINNNIRPENYISVIKKISSFNIKSIRKEENLKWLDTKLKYFFSQELSKKISHCENNYNEKLIRRIYEKNEEKKVISLLDMTIRDMWNIYVNGTTDENFIGFKTLEDDLDNFKINGESEEYIEEYRKISSQFECIFNKIISRKKRLSSCC